MKELLKKMKADFMLSSALCIILGIIIVIYRDGVINLIGRIIAVMMIVIGIVYLGSFLLGLAANSFSVVAGILVLAAGIWVLSQPAAVMSLVPVIIGVLLLFHGIRAVMCKTDGIFLVGSESGTCGYLYFIRTGMCV